MSNNLRIFVSTTRLTSINKEQERAFEAILEAGHIPMNMELCPLVINDFDNKPLIKIIDTANMYLLILDSTYEYIDNEIDYLYHEYTYAFSKIPVIVIILGNNLFQINNKKINLKYFKLNDKFKSSIVTKNNTITTYETLKDTIITLLNEYASSFFIEVNKETYSQNLFLLNTLYQFYPTSTKCFFQNKNIDKKLKQYFSICETYKIKTFSHVTANKCIIDPLGNPLSDISNICIDVSEVNDWMLNELNKNPTDLYQLSSRRFEELVAELLIRKGYNVELTPATRDGGKDIYASRKNNLGSFLYIVECKKYKPTHKVGVNVLRDLYGVLSKERATYGVAVTTSYFSKPAQDFQQELQFQMSLKDFDSIKQWLCDVTHNNIIT